jgi:hypothetical protein
MSRQVIIGAVVGFLATVTLMAVCQQKSSSMPNSDTPPAVHRVDDLQPANIDQPGGGVMPAPMPMRAPLQPLPATARPLNLEGYDAGRR